MRSVTRTVAALALLLVVTLPTAARGQATTGTIAGIVTDESKAVLPGVTVLVTNVETGIARTLITDATGQYRALNLSPGIYTVTAELSGFQTTARQNLTLEIGREVPADIALKVGGLSERITVQGSTSNVELSSSAAGGVVTTTQISELPLNGRNFMQLATLQPGVTVSRSTARDFTGGFGNTQISIGGARPEMTGYLLEGTNIADISDKAPSSMAGVLLGVDAVKEFSVQTHDYSAEFGRAAGGILSAVTKSGTNALHGTLFEFVRNSSMDAKNFFDPSDEPIPPFTRHQFGGTAGGPIVRNKFFYFANYEGLRERLSLTRLARLPNAAAHQGILPSGRVTIDPRVKPYLDLLYPIPNGQDFGDGTAELRHTDINPTNENFFVGKVDWQMTPNDSFFVRVSSDRSDATGYQDHPLFAEPTTTDTRYFTAQHQHLFSANVLNVVRGAVNRTGRTNDFVPTIDIPRNLYFTEDPHFGAITVTGLTQVGTTATTPVDYLQSLFEFSDTLTWSTRKHTMKFGANIQRYHFDGFSYSRFGGEFRFRNLQEFLTLNRGGGRLADRFTGNLAGTDTRRNMRQSYFSFFAQDEWRTSNDLTINYGLRYEFVTTPSDTQNRVAGLLKLEDLESGPGGVTPGSDFFKNPSTLSFAPRVGLAWKPRGDQRTSVKAGAGIFYQPLTVSYYRGTTFRIYPYFAGVDIRTVTVFGPPIQGVLSQGTGLSVQKRSEFISYDAKQPYTWHTHASLQHELPGKVVAEIGYMGSRGYNLPFYGDPNSVPVQLTADGRYQVIPDAPIRYPSWGRIRTRINAARSWYNGLTASVNRRFSDGLLFQASYTFGSSTDTWSGGQIGGSDFDNGQGSATDWWNPAAEKGPSSYDVRHTLVFNAVYELPFGRNLKGAAATLGHGWQVGIVANLASGIPFTPYIGYDYARDLSSDGNMQKPDLAPGRTAESATVGSPDNWYDAAVYVLPPAGIYGNAGRNSLRGPDLRVVDFSIFKNFRFGGRSLQFRAEIFNLLNRVNFATPDTTAGLFNPDGTRRPAATRITRTVTTSRQVQLGLKLVF